jgi:hypothetical protein
MLWLLLKLDHPIILIDLHDTELRPLFQSARKASHCRNGTGIDVVLDQFGVIHLVDVIARQDQQVVALALFNRVDVLVDGVGRSLIPVFVQPLLRRQDIDKFVEFSTEEAPAKIHVTVETDRLVLRQDQYLSQATIDAVRKCEVDDPVGTAKRDGRLRSIARERFQARSFSSCQNQCQHASHLNLLCSNRSPAHQGTVIYTLPDGK